ncbi:MAG TPA: S28 family serine protease [Bacteroidales bacterium]|nr:S28 family serine protease [Bacteroidales bacterium]
MICNLLPKSKAIYLYIFILLIFSSINTYASVSLTEFLSGLPVENIKILDDESFYDNILEVHFKQPIDHSDTTKGFFSQKLYISHYDSTKPVVLVTEGYSANYYYTSEPANILKCNQIIAEHRYYGESKPDSIDWDYLNAWQSASDNHTIIDAFKKFYPGEWITTGISKGGQSTIFHSYYYPDDADLRIPYVAPINNCVEDLRIYDFLKNVGSKKCRNKIKTFQEMALARQDELLPEFKRFSDRKNYTYKIVGGIEKAFEYCVLEYSFAFWQWGYASCSDIPGKNAPANLIISHMNAVAGFDYFADSFIKEYRPFFYQSYSEMGYYGYNLQEFDGYLRHVDDGTFQFALPKETDIVFNDSLLRNVTSYLQGKASDYIFIYGEYDTWSATAVNLGENDYSSVFYKKKGSHRARIRNMRERKQEKIKKRMLEYLAN